MRCLKKTDPATGDEFSTIGDVYNAHITVCSYKQPAIMNLECKASPDRWERNIYSKVVIVTSITEGERCN